MCDLRRNIINEYNQRVSEEKEKFYLSKLEFESKEKDMNEVEKYLICETKKNFKSMFMNEFSISQEEYELEKLIEETKYKLWKIRRNRRNN